MDDKHPLVELELLRAFDAFQRIQRVIASHRLPPSRRFNNSQAVEDEFYAVGERATGRLRWGWKRLPETGVLVKIVYEFGLSSLFVVFHQGPERDQQGQPDPGSWSIDILPSDPQQLAPLIRDIWQRLKLPDPEHLDDLTVLSSVDLIVDTFKISHANSGVHN